MKKKLIAMAMIMCLGFAAQSVAAAGESCPPHKNTETVSARVDHWTTTHKVYRNMYVDGKQVYSLCTISWDAVRYTMYCKDCHIKLHEEDTVYETNHSLAGDPDHK